MISLLLNLVLFVVGLYLVYIGYSILRIPNQNWEEYRKFKGNGRGMKLNSKGELVVVKYKTEEDCRRFINGLRVIDFSTLHKD